jgi:hypothetical protein
LNVVPIRQEMEMLAVAAVYNEERGIVITVDIPNDRWRNTALLQVRMHSVLVL